MQYYAIVTQLAQNIVNFLVISWVPGQFPDGNFRNGLFRDGQFPDWQFSDGHFPERTIPEWAFFGGTVNQMTFSQTDISPNNIFSFI